MDSQDPKAVRISPECVNSAALLHVPHPNGPVLRVADDVVLEVHYAAHIIHMPPKLLDLEAPGVIHLPYPNGTVVNRDRWETLLSDVCFKPQAMTHPSLRRWDPPTGTGVGRRGDPMTLPKTRPGTDFGCVAGIFNFCDLTDPGTNKGIIFRGPKTRNSFFVTLCPV